MGGSAASTHARKSTPGDSKLFSQPAIPPEVLKELLSDCPSVDSLALLQDFEMEQAFVDDGVAVPDEFAGMPLQDLAEDMLLDSELHYDGADESPPELGAAPPSADDSAGAPPLSTAGHGELLQAAERAPEGGAGCLGPGGPADEAGPHDVPALDAAGPGPGEGTGGEPALPLPAVPAPPPAPVPVHGLGRGGRGGGGGRRGGPGAVWDKESTPWGDLVWNQQGQSLGAHCRIPSHGLCRCNRSLNASRTKPHAGRPIAFLCVWMAIGDRFPDQRSHVAAANGSMITLPLRLEMRLWVSAVLHFVFLERQRLPGEGEEPDRVP
jgi:hypothetical protein